MDSATTPPGLTEQQVFSLRETLAAIFYAISWRQDAKLLFGLAAVPLALATSLRSRAINSAILHLSVASISLILILLAQPINSFAREHWRSISSQNYFDENGVFMSLFWSGPLLMVLLLTATLILSDLGRAVQELQVAKARPHSKEE